MRRTSGVLVAFALVLTAGSAVAQIGGNNGTSPDRPVGGRAVDVNRPFSPFECDTPIAYNWYGTRARCLQELCAGRNVFNEYIFDEAHRRRKNPCWGQNPTEVDD